MALPKSTPAKSVAVAIPGVPAPQKALSLVRKFAATYNVEDNRLLATLKETAFRQSKKEGAVVEVTDAQMMALLVVADQYGLNPFTREIYAFPDKGGIVPIVSIDGWIRIINERPELRSTVFKYSPEEEGDTNPWVECIITRSDRDEPVAIREYYKECYRNTDPWNNMPRRMLRHKALIQCARVAFGFAGVYDPDEAERIQEARTFEGEVVSHKSGTTTPKQIEAPKPVEGEAAAPPAQEAITEQLMKVLEERLEKFGVSTTSLLAHFEIGELGELPFAKADEAFNWIAEAARAQ